ncbi:hypothetical protein [Nostoc sp.]|uniref:hypothetical protein n=1 Tax=Nostoc sp. TaxID=1180 RepID=UPI002FF87338
MSSKPMDLTLTQKIEAELAKKDCNAGELKDATKATYPEIFAILKRLCNQGKVEDRFSYTNPLPTLIYSLKKPMPFWKN